MLPQNEIYLLQTQYSGKDFVKHIVSCKNPFGMKNRPMAIEFRSSSADWPTSYHVTHLSPISVHETKIRKTNIKFGVPQIMNTLARRSIYQEHIILLFALDTKMSLPLKCIFGTAGL